MQDTRNSDVPLRLLGRMAKMEAEDVCEAMAEVVEDHEERMQIPPKRTAPVQAIPFADERIPCDHLAAMISRMGRERCSLDEAATAYGYPLSLAQGAMADYQPAWRRFLSSASAHGRLSGRGHLGWILRHFTGY